MPEPTWGQRLLLAVIKLVLVAAGAVFALAALCAVLVLFCVWAVRRTWARLTGRPVAPWVLRTDPMAVWRQASAFRRGAQPAAAETAEQAEARRRFPAADVTDVTPK
ncbi:hypothetical protein GT347_04740 [Xylophilus rhododendri]|uniref:Uncharacterized protein n=1 Tax=Xylophilus rhododendri TaxID=2697032 RepID=A0A857J3A1_9BURK|nr:hypothetical protein [Xylophilus rhododendri]QHI97348.1 hypothetical protein GT347_04740 [Xylophilus rhododendri]